MIGSNLSRELGASVVVENVGGAGGTIGAVNVTRSAPDGYTLLVSVEASQTRATALYPTTRYHQVTSFTFIRKLARQRVLLVVHPSLPVTSIAELIAYAKARPGELTYSGTVGASSHVAGTIFTRVNDIDMTLVNYSGGSQPVTDLMIGTLKVGFSTEATISELIRSGRVRALATMAAERSPAFPDLPTVEEAGGGRVDISPWFGVVGPAGLPPAITTRLVEACDRIAGSAEFRERLETVGASPIHDSDPPSFRRGVEQEIVFWTAWARENQTQLR
jgi:tripartite-type tricarboxylate transporter receptor subunit TctC